MNRSPLFYPMARGADGEGGGAADLQTDVMRFMAILSLCLMVIFAVVQSVPAETERKPELTPPEPRTGTAVDSIADEPAPIKAKLIVVEEPKPLETPTSTPMQTVRTLTTPPPQDAAPADVQEGFTLRFETDRALTQLVSRNEIGLYAITAGKALRMTINQDKAEFWSASLPQRFHEMDTATVPESLVRALRNSTNSTTTTQWGVTLPTVMSAKLNTYMQDYRGGELIIGADGTLRMER